MKHLDDAELKFNLPDWMIEKHPEMMNQAAELAAQLINEEGYSDEQAFQIALERINDDSINPPVDETLVESDIRGEPLE